MLLVTARPYYHQHEHQQRRKTETITEARLRKL